MCGFKQKVLCSKLFNTSSSQTQMSSLYSKIKRIGLVHLLIKNDIFLHFVTLAFLFKIFGNVPNCVDDGSRSTWLLMSDGTDSVLLIFETRKKQKTKASLKYCSVCGGWGETVWSAMNITWHLLGIIWHWGASLVHLLWHFNLKVRQPLADSA